MTLKLDKNFALLYGIMLGDGCLSYSKIRHDYAICVVGSYYVDQDLFRFVIKPALERLRGKPVRIEERPRRGSLRIGISDKNLFTKFSSVGFPIGKKGVKLAIPRIFLSKPKLMKHIIAGIFATDGCLVLAKNPNKYYPWIEFKSISGKLLTQVHNHLKSLGLNSKLYFIKNLRQNNDKDVYKIQINGLKNLSLFKRKIGFVNSKHAKRYALFLEYNKRYNQAIKGIPNQKQRFYRIENLDASARI